MARWLENFSWPKAALFGGVVLAILLIVHPPTAERILAAIIEIVQILSNTFGG